MSEKKQDPQVSMAASFIAMRGVRIFLNAGKGAAEKRTSPTRSRRTKAAVPGNKLQLNVMEILLKNTRFAKYVSTILSTTYLVSSFSFTKMKKCLLRQRDYS
ncbi:jg13567 [Pararge aegeria aegeria]|uniref:Jg13567 protein n=1 Tax=Pararge aegeria aegeria TaxID=348720 RepID=A0A8S4QWF6_9NEOP|nr:jg13567 [Pararge aegeria aegeria]